MGAMTQAHAQVQKPLQTSRPWLTVAGCMGGGVLAAVVVLLVVAAILVVVLFFPRLVGLGGGDAPPTAFLTAIGELRKAPALKVATREISVRVDVTVPTEASVGPWLGEWLGWKVELGRTTAEVVAPSNTVQYIVPLQVDGVAVETPVSFGKRGGEPVWRVVLPPPRVDATLVEVQSDPRRLRVEVDRDWVDHLVGDDSARDAALASIRAAVIRQASSEVAMFEVREKGRAVVADMIRALLPAEHRGRRIEVRWSDESGQAEEALTSVGDGDGADRDQDH
jgi:hypothetical protein